VNGVNVILDHQAELALTDSQAIRINAIKRALDSTTAPLLKRVDAARARFAPTSGGSPAPRDSLVRAGAMIQEVMTAVRDSVHAARDRAFALLTPAQLTKALEFQDTAQRELDDEQRNAGHGRGSVPTEGSPPRS
jgi:hypothetical protein